MWQFAESMMSSMMQIFVHTADTILQRMEKYDESSIVGDVFTSEYLTMDLVQ